MKPAPVVPLNTEAEQEFYDSYTHSRRMAARRLKRRFENLERRLQRMEHIVTTREFDWESKLKEWRMSNAEWRTLGMTNDECRMKN